MYEKIVIISDLHAQYCNWDYLRHLVEHHSDADILVVGGDIFDGYGISKYPRDHFVPLLHEYKKVSEIFQYLTKHFKRIVVIGGNHDFRWERVVVAQTPLEARPFVGEPLLTRACRGDVWDGVQWTIGKGYKNVELQKIGSSVSWYWYYKGILVSHAEKYTKTPGAVGEATANFFRRKLGVDPKLVVNNHTHRLFMLYYPNIILAESGCMCEEAEYANMNPTLKYSEQMNGYLIATLKDDVVCPELTYVECLSSLS